MLDYEMEKTKKKTFKTLSSITKLSFLKQILLIPVSFFVSLHVYILFRMVIFHETLLAFIGWY